MSGTITPTLRAMLDRIKAAQVNVDVEVTRAEFDEYKLSGLDPEFIISDPRWPTFVYGHKLVVVDHHERISTS